MKRAARIIGIAIAVVLLLVVGVALLVDANQFRPELESTLSATLGRQVRLGNLRVSLLSGGVTANDLSVTDDPAFSPSPFVRAKSLKVGVELWPLIFSHQLNVQSLTIDEPAVSLLQTPAGAWNFSTLGTRAKTPPAQPASTQSSLDLSARLVKITAGHFLLGEAHGKSRPLVLENVNLELRDFSPASAFPFSFSAKVAGGGDVKLDGKAGPLNEKDLALTPVEASLNVAQLDLTGSGLVQPVTGIAGIVSFEGKGNSNGEVVAVDGRLRGEKLKLVKNGAPARRPVQFDFTVEHDLSKRSGVLRRGNLHFGSAPATLTGSYNLKPDSAVLNLVFSGPKMAIPELEGLLPAVDIELPAGSSLQGGTASAKINIEGPIDRLVTSGTMGLSQTRLVGFDLGNKMAAMVKLAGIQAGPNTDIQTLAVSLHTAPDGTSVPDLQLVVPSIGNLAGSGTVSPGHVLDFKMRATLHTSGSIMAALGQKGDTGVPFTITGTSANPVFRPDVKAIASQKIDQEVKSLTGNSDLGKTATGLLNNLLGGKKKQ
jgi:AsmA protein